MGGLTCTSGAAGGTAGSTPLFAIHDTVVILQRPLLLHLLPLLPHEHIHHPITPLRDQVIITRIKRNPLNHHPMIIQNHHILPNATPPPPPIVRTVIEGHDGRIRVSDLSLRSNTLPYHTHV